MNHFKLFIILLLSSVYFNSTKCDYTFSSFLSDTSFDKFKKIDFNVDPIKTWVDTNVKIKPILGETWNNALYRVNEYTHKLIIYAILIVSFLTIIVLLPYLSYLFALVKLLLSSFLFVLKPIRFLLLKLVRFKLFPPPVLPTTVKSHKFVKYHLGEEHDASLHFAQSVLQSSEEHDDAHTTGQTLVPFSKNGGDLNITKVIDTKSYVSTDYSEMTPFNEDCELFGSVTVDNTTKCGVQSTILLPDEIYEFSSLKRLMLRYTYFTYDIEFLFVPHAHPLMTGMVGFFWTADPSAGTDPAFPSWESTLFTSQHTLIDISKVDPVSMIIRRNSGHEVESRGHTNPGLAWGNLYFALILPIDAPESVSSTVTLDVYFRLINVKQVLQGTLMQSQENQRSPYFSTNLPYYFVNNVTSPVDSTIVEQFFDTTTITNSVASANNATLPTNVTGDKIDLEVSPKLGLSALDYPSYTSNSLNTYTPRLFQKLNYAKGAVNVSRMTINGSDQCLLADNISSIDEMDLNFFKGKFFDASGVDNTPTGTDYSHYTIPSSTAIGSKIFDIDMNYTANRDLLTTDSFNIQQSFGLNATYWRGSLHFRVLVTCPPLASGQLALVPLYDRTNLEIEDPDYFLHSVPLNFYTTHQETEKVAVSTVPFMVVDFSKGSGIYDVCCNFVSRHRMLRTVGFPAGTMSYLQWARYSMGSFAGYLLSPLKVSVGSPNNVRVRVLMAFGEDMQFFNSSPYPMMGWLYGYRPPPPPVVGQALMTVGSKLKQLTGLDTLHSIKQLCLKPHFMQYFSVQAGGSPYELFYTSQSIMSYLPYSQSYAAYTGSLRFIFRILTKGTASAMKISYFPSVAEDEEMQSKTSLFGTITLPDLTTKFTPDYGKNVLPLAGDSNKLMNLTYGFTTNPTLPCGVVEPNEFYFDLSSSNEREFVIEVPTPSLNLLSYVADAAYSSVLRVTLTDNSTTHTPTNLSLSVACGDDFRFVNYTPYSLLYRNSIFVPPTVGHPRVEIREHGV